MVCLWCLYLCWQAFYLGFDSGKQLRMYLTLNLFIGLLKLMNFLTGWNLNVCSAGSGLLWVMLRVQDLGVWGRQKGLCWHRCCCIRFFDHCKSGYGNIKGVTRESTNSPKGKKICSLLNWEKSAPTQETLLCFICVALSIAPPAQLFVGMQLLWSCFLHLCWLQSTCPWP